MAGTLRVILDARTLSDVPSDPLGGIILARLEAIWKFPPQGGAEAPGHKRVGLVLAPQQGREMRKVVPPLSSLEKSIVPL